MAHDVFISYSTQDKLTADAVCGILEASGIRCWIAPRDIPLGEDWTESIVDAIESTPIMVLVFSAHANESHQIKREVNLAVDNGRTVIPVRVEDVMPSKSLKFSININHWLDAFPAPLENHFHHLAKSIRAHLDVAKANPTPAPSAPSQPAEPSVSSATAAAAPVPVFTPPPTPPLQPAAEPARPMSYGVIAVSACWFALFLFIGVMLGGLLASSLDPQNKNGVVGLTVIVIILAFCALSVWLSFKGLLPGTRR
jgi:hypothetical protein